MSINQINNGDSGLTARTIINQVVTNTNNLPTTGTASYAITASYAMNGGGTSINTSSFATTSSNNFVGDQTISGSLQQGDNVLAIGDWSHAEGRETQAIGDYSHAEGYKTIASGSYQHISGQFNTHGDDTSLFIIGNGTYDNETDTETRSDAFKVRQSGSIILPITSSGAPNWTGTQGEMIFGDNGSGNYVIWAYLGGNWRSGSLS